jgi:putative SOS response-associated peptidase YedK
MVHCAPPGWGISGATSVAATRVGSLVRPASKLPRAMPMKDPTSGEWIRTFAIITTDANELVAEIHDRMPLILAPPDDIRWLSDEPDPRDLMRPFPAEPRRMWPISTKVNKPKNDDPSVIEPNELTAATA